MPIALSARVCPPALSGRTVLATIREADRTLAVSYGPSRDGHGETVGAIGVALDITEAKQWRRPCTSRPSSSRR